MSLYSRAENMYVSQNFQDAFKLFFESFSLGLDINDSMNYLGCCELMLGNYNQAIQWFDELIIQAPEWERPVTNKGRVFLKLGRLDEAYVLFKKAENMNTNNEDLYYYLGIYYEHKNDLKAAKEAYEKSLYIDDEQEETLLNYGRILWKLQYVNEAANQFLKLLAIDPNHEDALRNLGILMKQR